MFQAREALFRRWNKEADERKKMARKCEIAKEKRAYLEAQRAKRAHQVRNYEVILDIVEHFVLYFVQGWS
jgi:hypothetical protein